MTVFGVVAASLYADMNAARSGARLTEVERVVWQEWAAKRVTDAEAQSLSEILSRMKSTGATAKAVGAMVGRLGSRLVSRQRPRDARCDAQTAAKRKARRERRRTLGGSSALPDTLRHHYTEGQRSVLCVVATEIKASGACEKSIKEIADIAGVCRTTVQNTLHEARRLGHLRIQERPQRGRKSLTNVIEILSKEWLSWIKRGPRRSLPDRVQSPHTAQRGEPPIEVRGIEEGRRAGTNGASDGWMRPAWRPMASAMPTAAKGRRQVGG